MRVPGRWSGPAEASSRGCRGAAVLALAAVWSAGCGAAPPTAPSAASQPLEAACRLANPDCAVEAAVSAQNQAPVLQLKTTPLADKRGPIWTLSGAAPFSIRLNLCTSSDPDQVINPDGTQDPSGDVINWQFNFGDPADYEIGADGTPSPDPAVAADGSFRADSAGSCRVDHSYATPGTYIATVSVTDKHLEDQARDVAALARETQRLRIEVFQGRGREYCFYNSTSGLAAGLIGPFNGIGNAEFYSDPLCLEPFAPLPRSSLILAPSHAQGLAYCQRLGTVLFFGRLSDIGYAAPPQFWGCDLA